MTQDEIRLRTLAGKNNLAITDIQLSSLNRYAELLKGWNQRINLVSRKDEESVWANHIPISLAFLFMIQFPKGARVLDLGTGGGLPGIPLSVMLPDVNFVLIDSIQKKISAVQDMVSALGLKNASTLCGRAEDLNTRSELRHSFDAVIARSVSRLENLVFWSMPFLKPRGSADPLTFRSEDSVSIILPSLITVKGGETEDEIIQTRKRFPGVHIHTLNLSFKGSETLQNSDKKLVIVENG